jgi:hypothetical protein
MRSRAASAAAVDLDEDHLELRPQAHLGDAGAHHAAADD